MNYWLLKTEPESYSFADLQRDKRTVWDGVTNSWALKFLREMKKGDRAFVYHTGKEKSIVGIAEIAADPHADPKTKDEKLPVVDLKAVQPLKQPVSLAQIKKDKRFANFELVKFSRLSVMPVTPAHWEALMAMSNG